MANFNAIINEFSPEVRNLERRTSKVHISIPHNTTPINNSGSHTAVRNSGDYLSLRHRRLSRYSFPRGGHDRRSYRYENTYRMEPPKDHKLDLIRIHRVATSVIATTLDNYKYNADQATDFAGVLAERIRNQMKQLPFPRYRIVSVVTIGQKKGQAVCISSRCLWDPKLDQCITITKETMNAYITATIFFIYTE